VTVSSGDLERAIDGDMTVIQRLAEAPHTQLAAAWAASAKPFVKAVTVVRVVESLVDGEIGEVEVQKWASLLKNGYLERFGEPIVPIDVAYEPEFEEEINEVIFDLEKLDDFIDGGVYPSKLRELIAPLKR
jgi:hypothetical protein